MHHAGFFCRQGNLFITTPFCCTLPARRLGWVHGNPRRDRNPAIMNGASTPWLGMESATVGRSTENSASNNNFR
jgi:hypothetical protein